MKKWIGGGSEENSTEGVKCGGLEICRRRNGADARRMRSRRESKDASKYAARKAGPIHPDALLAD